MLGMCLPVLGKISLLTMLSNRNNAYLSLLLKILGNVQKKARVGNYDVPIAVTLICHREPAFIYLGYCIINIHTYNLV